MFFVDNQFIFIFCHYRLPCKTAIEIAKKWEKNYENTKWATNREISMLIKIKRQSWKQQESRRYMLTQRPICLLIILLNYQMWSVLGASTSNQLVENSLRRIWWKFDDNWTFFYYKKISESLLKFSEEKMHAKHMFQSSLRKTKKKPLQRKYCEPLKLKFSVIVAIRFIWQKLPSFAKKLNLIKGQTIESVSLYAVFRERYKFNNIISVRLLQPTFALLKEM